MMDPKRLQNAFTWESPQGSGRRPVFWLALQGGRSGELFFVNDLEEPLTSMAVAPGGFMTADDDTLTLQVPDYHYHDVASGEAVKVGEFDGYYDLDYLFQLSIEVTSPKVGKVLMRTPLKKGIYSGQAFPLADDGFPFSVC